MCKKIDYLENKINEIELMTLKIKAINFKNFQSFDYVNAHYEVGEIYIVKNIGYTVVTSKSDQKITFVVIMQKDATWERHWQDVDKIIEIKQGTYLDLFTGKEYKDNVTIKAFEPSYFKAIGEDDLIIKGTIFKNKLN